MSNWIPAMASETPPLREEHIGLIIISFFLLINIFIFSKIFKKFRYNLEPVHVFLMNYFGMLAFRLIVNGIILLLALYPVSEEWCYQYNVFLASELTFMLGIISMQIDRFLAIYWNLHYANRVTTRKAILIVCIIPVIAVAASIAALVIDRDNSKCILSFRLIFTRTTNITLLGSMTLLAMAATIVTSAYSVKVIFREKSKNSVHPDPRNMPLQTISQPSMEPMPIVTQRLDEDPSMFFLVENQMIFIPAVIAPVDEEQADIQFKTSAFFQMLQTSTTMNLLNLIFIFGLVPTVIHGMANHNCKSVWVLQCCQICMYISSESGGSEETCVKVCINL